jgi:hypothetical protein
MINKEEKYIKTWDKIIKKGKTTYVIKVSLLWSVLVTFLTPFFIILFDLDFTRNRIIEEYNFKSFIIRFVIFYLFGILYSLVLWKNGVKRYNKLSENKDV